MAETVIKVQDLGKKYIIGHQGKSRYKTFREQMILHAQHLYSRTKQMLTGHQVVEGDEMEEFWALKDVSFELKQGEILGIIGRNGAGKSTLLKILSRITEPTTGKITLKGRIASLLEVGTGFHPELTGRENIFLNGAILGMSRVDIKRKFDEIVDFSGVEKFLDTPVKRYSSGMYVRLAFSVAAHLEPEILIVDEVLAVGDTEFQRKCLGRMQDVSKNDGRTVLFVSHNMGMLTQLCTNGILLNFGELIMQGKIADTIDHYLHQSSESAIIAKSPKDGTNEFALAGMYNKDNTHRTEFKFDEEIMLKIEMELEAYSNDLELAMRLIDKYKNGVFTIHERLEPYVVKSGNHLKLSIKIPARFITPGRYSWIMCINRPGVRVYDLHEDVLAFTVIDTGSEFARYDGEDYGRVFAQYSIQNDTED